MSDRRGVVTFFLFFFLAIIILLQIHSMVQSDRFYEGLNRLDESFGRSAAVGDKYKDVTTCAGSGDYPGDDGDWLIWAFRVEPRTLNQISVDGDIYSRWLTTPNIFEPLLIYDFDQVTLKPHLAESYEVSDDGLEITFRLRDDIYFSDGAAITTDDVVFTYETIVNPKVDAANLANLFVDVERVVQIDKRAVKFIMKRAHFKALEIVSFWDIGIFPKHIYQFTDAQEFNKHRSGPVGSGPYVFEKWDVGSQIVLRRNENYWGPKPKLKKIVYKFIPNTVAGVQALRSGRVDIVILEPEQFADLVKDPEFGKQFNCVAYWTAAVPFYYIGWNQDTVFFSDKRVRQAMTCMINRRQIIERLLEGHGREITGPFYIKGSQNDPEIEPWPYDLERAAELLNEAGWVDSDGDGLRDKDGVPFRFRFMYSGSYTLYQRLAKLLKDEAAKLGIDVVLDPYEWSVVFGRLNDREFESMVMGWGGDILQDPYQIWHSSQIGNRGYNYVGFNNSRADAIIEEVRRTLDDEKRNGLCRRLHRILHEEQPYTFLFARPTFRFVDRRFKNVVVHKLGFKYLEWYVPENEQRYN